MPLLLENLKAIKKLAGPLQLNPIINPPFGFLLMNMIIILNVFKLQNDSVAQLAEQQTLNLWVQGSSPCGVTSTMNNG